MSKRKYSAFHGSAANMDNADGQAQVHKRARTRTRKRTPPLAPSSPSAPSAAAGNSLKGGQIASTTLKDVGGPGKGSYNGHQENRKGGRQGQGQQAPNRNTRISRGRISRPAQNKRQTDERPLMNEERIRREFTVPTRIDYPTAHASLFGSKMATTLHNLGGNVLRIRPEYISIGNSNLRCTLHYTPPNGSPENVVGEGLGKSGASRAAHLLLMVRLHEAGILGQIFLPQIEQIDKQTLKDEADAKADIYNYAARFGFVPQFSMRNIERPLRRLGKSQVEVTMELPEQGIKVVGRHYSLDLAEISAAVRFKQEAEKYHAEHGDGSIVIKDSAALTTDNVKSFFDFYRLKHPGSRLEATVEASSQHWRTSKGAHTWEATVLLNGEKIGETITMITKKKAEEISYLVAAVLLLQKDPDMMSEFRAALSPSGEILLPIKPITMEIDPDAVTVMQETLREVRSAGLPNIRVGQGSDEDTEATRSLRTRRPLSDEEIKARSQALKSRLNQFSENPNLAGLRAKKEALPMSQYRDQVISHIGNNQYSVIVGATGSGKTTQVPQILLEDAIARDEGARCNVVCTQPRRIAATSVAQRVAAERNEQLQDTVGYHVRFDPKLPKLGGSVTYCTTGILLKQLQQAPDEVFDRVSHIVVDEVHERDIMIDFLLIILKEAVRNRRSVGKSTPKIVLMSATINSDMFGKYFEEKTDAGVVIPCPSLSVPGRTFPVKEKYYENIMQELEEAHPRLAKTFLESDLNTRDFLVSEGAMSRSTRAGDANDTDQVAEATIDWKSERVVTADGQVVNEKEDSLIPINLVAATIAHISKTTDDGAILVFLPGFDEIKKVREAITRSPLGVNFHDESTYKIFTLHSSVPASEQAEVFNPVPNGCRKIILSTNIAETSVTIPDVQHVVDSGKLREKRYDQIRRITRLQCTWISKSNAKQRAGRAGRVRNGNYYALYSRSRYESLRSIGLPEMLRSDLQEVCLDIKAQAFKAPIREFLGRAIEAPLPEAIDAAVQNLQALEALTEDESLTALGRLLASLPVHPSLGKMIILGVIFRCLDPMIILGAALNERNLFVSPPDKRREAVRAQMSFLEGSNSDHYALVNAFTQLRLMKLTRGPNAVWEFANRNFIHNGAFKTMESTTHQIEDILVDAGLIPYTHPRDKFEGELGHPKLNKNSTNIQLIKALLLAGTHPNLAASVGRTFRTPGEKNAMVHPSSTNAAQHSRSNNNESGIGELLAYSTMMKSADGNSTFLRDTTASTPLSATLFGGKLKARNNIIEMDGWLPFFVRASIRDVRTIMEFRKAMDRLLSAAFQELSQLKQNKTRGSEAYLADDKQRETFASGLVEALNKDIYKPPAPRSFTSKGGGARTGDDRRAGGEGRGDRYARRDGASYPSSRALHLPQGERGYSGSQIRASQW